MCEWILHLSPCVQIPRLYIILTNLSNCFGVGPMGGVLVVLVVLVVLLVVVLSCPLLGGVQSVR